jgi:hypothetical protein
MMKDLLKRLIGRNVRRPIAPPADVVAGPGVGRVRIPLGAALLRDAADFETDAGRDEGLASHLDGADIRVFAMNGTSARMPVRGGESASLFGPMCSGQFDHVWIGRTIPLYDAPWGRAFLLRAAQLLAPEGRMYVPIDAAGRARGVFPADAAASFLSAPDAFSTGHRLSVAGVNHDRPVRSILSWYFAHLAEVILEDLRIRLMGPNTDPLLSDRLCAEYLLPSDALEASVVRENEPPAANIDDAINLAVRRQAYQVGGISSKAALVRHITRQYFGDQRNLRFADMGGGYGLLAAELLLDGDCGISDAVVVDISPYNLSLSALLYRGLRTELAGRFRLWLGGSEAYRANGTVHVASFIGSLLYIPKDQTMTALEHAWESLESDGILVVHENIRHPRFTADYERMFTVEELDAMLERFGAIERVHQTACQSTTLRQAGERTVYRVVRKA